MSRSTGQKGEVSSVRLSENLLFCDQHTREERGWELSTSVKTNTHESAFRCGNILTLVSVCAYDIRDVVIISCFSFLQKTYILLRGCVVPQSVTYATIYGNILVTRMVSSFLFFSLDPSITFFSHIAQSSSRCRWVRHGPRELLKPRFWRRRTCRTLHMHIRYTTLTSLPVLFFSYPRSNGSGWKEFGRTLFCGRNETCSV